MVYLILFFFRLSKVELLFLKLKLLLLSKLQNSKMLTFKYMPWGTEGLVVCETAADEVP